MPDLEKAIRWLELCGYQDGMPQCDSCPYDGKDCWTRLKRDAISLLKAQVPRVMTLKEVKLAKVCWIEFESRIFPAIYYCQGNGNRFSVFIVNGNDDVFEDYEEDLDDNEIWAENYFMNQLWRCWTSRPTDAQREAVKWDE